MGRGNGEPEQTRLREEVASELSENILPFWIAHAVDRENGGFYGAVTNDLQVRDDVPRSSVLCSRILWTYSVAHQRLGRDEYLAMARRAYDYLRSAFWDEAYDGLFWQVDRRGGSVSERKHHYAQAFGVFGLAEYYRAAGDRGALDLARRLFALLEEHAFDPRFGGYVEGSSRSWGPLLDRRLGETDLDCPKSMNTMLHVLEAYTALLHVWDNSQLRSQHRRLVETLLDRVVDPQTGHFRLFFDERWNPLSTGVSFGHDIEGSWLLCQAADAQGDRALRARVEATALRLAEAVLREGVDPDGSLRDGAPGAPAPGKAWWPQAEALVGFQNAYELSGRGEFAGAVRRSWAYVQERMVDRVHGDWFKELRPDGTPDPSALKVGPWNCPYHHSRACFELLSRLGHEPSRK